MVVQACDRQLVIKVSVFHEFVSRVLDLLQPFQLVLDGDFQLLLGLRNVDKPVKSLHTYKSFSGLIAQYHQFIILLLVPADKRFVS